MPAKLFEKGHPGLKKPGDIGKASKAMKEFIKDLTDENREKVTQTLQGLEGETFLKYWLQLIQFVIPKKASIEQISIKELPPELNALTYEQLDQIERIIKGTQPAYKLLDDKS